MKEKRFQSRRPGREKAGENLRLSGGSSAAAPRSVPEANFAPGPARPVSNHWRPPNKAPCKDAKNKILKSAFHPKKAPKSASKYLSPPPRASLRKTSQPVYSNNLNAIKAATAPARAVSNPCHPRNTPHNKPAAMPDNVNSNGKIQCLASINASGKRKTIRRSAQNNSNVQPKRHRHNKNKAAHKNSTTGY